MDKGLLVETIITILYSLGVRPPSRKILMQYEEKTLTEFIGILNDCKKYSEKK